MAHSIYYSCIAFFGSAQKALEEEITYFSCDMEFGRQKEAFVQTIAGPYQNQTLHDFASLFHWLEDETTGPPSLGSAST